MTPKRTSEKLPFEPDYYEGNPDFNIYSWCPTPTPTVPPTQVHLHADALDGRVKFVFRFKGPGTLDRLIDALISHREDVWGKRK